MTYTAEHFEGLVFGLPPFGEGGHWVVAHRPRVSFYPSVAQHPRVRQGLERTERVDWISDTFECPPTRIMGTRQGDACPSTTCPSNQEEDETTMEMEENEERAVAGARVEGNRPRRRPDGTRAPKDRIASESTIRNRNEIRVSTDMRTVQQETNNDESTVDAYRLHEQNRTEPQGQKKKKSVHGRKKTPFVDTSAIAPTTKSDHQALVKPKKKGQAYSFFKSIGCILRGKSHGKAKAKCAGEKIEQMVPAAPANQLFLPSPSSSERSDLTDEFHVLDTNVTDGSVSSCIHSDARTTESLPKSGSSGDVLTKHLVLAKLENFRKANVSEFYTCGQDPSNRAAWFLNVEQQQGRLDSSPAGAANEKACRETTKKGRSKAIDKGSYILVAIPGKPSIVIPKLDLSWTISHTVPVVKKKKGILASFVSKLSPEPTWSPKPKVSLPGLSQTTSEDPGLPGTNCLQNNKLHRKRSWH